ncbi:S-adenosyl-L-methionine-dependent methyltransferase, partial [Jimgerdemannia flammicorona]
SPTTLYLFFHPPPSTFLSSTTLYLFFHPPPSIFSFIHNPLSFLSSILYHLQRNNSPTMGQQYSRYRRKSHNCIFAANHGRPHDELPVKLDPPTWVVSQPNSPALSADPAFPSERRRSSYFLPHDDNEVDRNIMPSAEHCIRVGARVLDIGTGPGTWILDTATDNPEAEFIGLDISGMFPMTIKPGNANFVQVDVVTEGLPFPSESFDLVQMRMMNLAWTNDDWPKVMSEIFRVLKQGGCVQMMELHGDYVTKDPDAKHFVEMVQQFIIAQRMDPFVATQLPALQEQVGFKVVQYDVRKIPIGWGGVIGKLMMDDIRQVMLGSKSILAPAFGLDGRDFDGYIDHIMRRFGQSQAYANGYMVVGRKPAAGERPKGAIAVEE